VTKFLGYSILNSSISNPSPSLYLSQNDRNDKLLIHLPELSLISNQKLNLDEHTDQVFIASAFIEKKLIFSSFFYFSSRGALERRRERNGEDSGRS
jgi:hypothetical protein